ncbi:hypothetical protein B9Z65_8921 [Elsinoe australis]|uniref:CCHC-type domain-containing protein n=1 Tax=Elsinoe australis TaxID=40998 RepID=A0A2P7YBU4_9PEZI|nr:hypothetical protein B9Z65_8921 [Elsinoe australis]
MSTTGPTSGERHRSSRDEDTRDGKRGIDVEPFYGDRAQLRRFLIQLKTLFKLEGSRYPSHQSRVLYASSRLRGSAFSWFEPYIGDFLTDTPEDETKAMFSNFEEFEKRIKQVFNISDEERVAATKIRQLKQRGSAAQYYSQFQQLAMHLDWDDGAKASAYYEGLSDSVKDQMLEGPPSDLKRLIDMSIRIDNRLYERRMEKKGGYRTMPRYSKNNHDYGDPMELDAMRQGHPSRNKGQRKGKFLSGKEREKCRNENLCFKCERPGHRARDCRSGAPADGLHMMTAGPVEKKADTTAEDLTTNGVGKETQKEPEQVRGSDIPSEDADKGAIHDNEQPSHGTLSWSACYNDSCHIHLSDKEAAGWFPYKPTKRKSQKPRYPCKDPETFAMMESDDIRHYAVIDDNDTYTLLLTDKWDHMPDRNGVGSSIYSPHGETKNRTCLVLLRKCTKLDCKYEYLVHSHDVIGDDAVDLSAAAEFMVMSRHESCSQEIRRAKKNTRLLPLLWRTTSAKQ